MRQLSLIVSIVVLATVATAQQVTLPLDRYDELRREAEPPPVRTPLPAAEAALEGAAITVEIEPGAARVSYRLDVVLLAAGRHEIGLPDLGSLAAADLGGLAGRVDAEPGGLRLVVTGDGRATVSLETVVRVVEDELATRRTLACEVPIPRAARVEVTVGLPTGIDEVVAVTGGVALSFAGDGRARFTAAPGGTLVLNARGRQRAADAATLPARTRGRATTMVRIGRTALRVHAWLTLEVLQGRAAELRASVPTELEVVTVAGAEIAGWDLDGRELVVLPLAPIADELTVEVELEGPPATAFASPLVVPVADEVSLATAVQVMGDGLLELEQGGASRLPAPAGDRWVPHSARGPSCRVVTDAADPPRWRVSFAEATEVLAAQVDRLLYDVIAGRSGRARVRLWLAVRSSGAISVGAALPPGFELIAVSRDGRAVTPGRDGDLLVVPLAASGAVEQVGVEGLLPLTLPAGRGLLELPVPALTAPVATVAVRLALPAPVEWQLRPPATATNVGAPPAPATVGSTADALLAALAAPVAAGAGSVPRRDLETPAGYRVVTASWTALIASPGPLVLELEREPAEGEWF